MAKRAKNQDALYHTDGGADEAVLDEDEGMLVDSRYDRLEEGCMRMPNGGALRMRPSGYGPDAEGYGFDN